MKKHELSKLFPSMGEHEIRELAADIKLNGLHSPIVTHEGAILDGAQRERACKIARVPAQYVEFHNLSPALWRNGPLAFVVSENLRRRHLTPETQGELHRKLVPLVEQHLKEEAEKASSLASASKTARKHRRTGNKPSGKPTQHKDEAVKQVATMTGSSPATVYRNISNGSKEKVEKPPSMVLKLADSLETLIEQARLNNGSLQARLDDYVISVKYSPKTKLLPVVKTLSVEPCSTSQ